MDTCRNKNVIITSKRRRFDVMITLLLRFVPNVNQYHCCWQPNDAGDLMVWTGIILARFARNIPGAATVCFNKGTFQKHLWALRCWHLNKMHISQCMGKIFCVEFQRDLKISYPYIERYDFYTKLKFQELLHLRVHKCTPTPWTRFCFWIYV